ncbi:hypothetical protein BN7_1132 [Wickerhamomyces ciferrii]|uniref:4-hydroxy-4-methyl-2-oxoglutarate aldolase n=1 Tax=Wickerhamomyces ciferrii (strain ATCC 14091 / BCRC 22168 / CBS 111 / JCM 3599 / NBRC 0793 / NRRL Y-1031 F-60-10) TaxID=1206466 RepID=K0KF53_WICCF|nr:uncharacterized protein BN7_1132 [Wickerhamomyces ciferrii]CCH41591.1 hypothetical protein BN7_1132 [Wickerhamomyces ciferrii]
MTSQAIKNATKFLKQYTPCDISDGLVKHGLKNGGFFPNLKQYSFNPTTKNSIAGPAYTVLYAPSEDPRPAVKGGYIDTVPEGSVVVIGVTKELQTRYAPYVTVNNALYGGLMSTRAKYLQANGTVVFGRIRDVNEHRDLEYPVLAYGLGTTASQGTVKVVGINVPLEINIGNDDKYEVIKPQDLIIADENGVVRIPDDVDLDSLFDYAPKRVKADQLVSEDIKAGKLAVPSQKEHRSKI